MNDAPSNLKALTVSVWPAGRDSGRSSGCTITGSGGFFGVGGRAGLASCAALPASMGGGVWAVAIVESGAQTRRQPRRRRRFFMVGRMRGTAKEAEACSTAGQQAGPGYFFFF